MKQNKDYGNFTFDIYEDNGIFAYKGTKVLQEDDSTRVNSIVEIGSDDNPYFVAVKIEAKDANSKEWFKKVLLFENSSGNQLSEEEISELIIINPLVKCILNR